MVADPFDADERAAALDAIRVLDFPNAIDCRHMNCPISFEDSSTDLELADRFFRISSKYGLTEHSFALTVQDLVLICFFISFIFRWKKMFLFQIC